MTTLAPTLQMFFTDRLVAQRSASPNTVASYRDTFRLLIAFAADKAHKQPSALDISDLDAPMVSAFLSHLESHRQNGVSTRNNRLAAVHSLFRYASYRHPEHADSIRRVLAIPSKRSERHIVTYLDNDEVNALLAACDRATWTGRRDHAMIVLAVQTGLRVSELASLTVADITTGSGAHVRTMGKGRKDRCTPLVSPTIAVLQSWLAERHALRAEPLFPTSTGRRLSRDAVERRLALYVARAGDTCPSLRSKRVTPHTLRHTAAMRLLLAGNDVTVIALWLGHEQVATTNAYLHADVAQKERAIARVLPPETRPGRYKPADHLLTFLEGL